jgi:glycosyltransferase involved in cell wall biosynthesis
MIIGSMVVKNEVDRYLQASLTRLLECCHKVFVVDDQSDDDSADLAREMGCTVWVRDDATPSFKENESAFRQAAWSVMGTTLKLKDRDWILSLDADECFLGTFNKNKELVRQADHRVCFSLPVPEAWSVNPIQVRTDGYWNNNYSRRFARYDKNRKFLDATMGCGSVPYHTGPSTELASHMGILHFGYADEEDRKKKYEFYHNRIHGHSNSHIESILKKPKLEPFEFEYDFWRGIK